MGWNTGKHPAKIYTIDGVLIYQVDDGTTNNGKTPLGGIIVQGSAASSMLDAIANPITFYLSSVINQAGHSRDLYDYYWISYSRGTDGDSYNGKPNWHNAYLDGYIPLRAKSIYDPCPYLYRIPSNGTYNQITSNPGWTGYSYLGGVSWNMIALSTSWFSGLGWRSWGSSVFEYTGDWGFYRSSISGGQIKGYVLGFNSSKGMQSNRNDYRSHGHSVRCIEFANSFANSVI